MIKLVKVGDLKLGMYIHDLNCGWMEHGFLRSKFMLRKEEDLQKLQGSRIGELYIDTVRGIDICDGQPQQESDSALERRIQATTLRSHNLPAKTSHAEELSIAQDIQAEAS